MTCPTCGRPFPPDRPEPARVQMLRHRLRSLGWHDVAAARRGLVRAWEADQPCANGHFGCAIFDGGRCLAEVAAIVAELDLEATAGNAQPEHQGSRRVDLPFIPFERRQPDPDQAEREAIEGPPLILGDRRQNSQQASQQPVSDPRD